MGPAEPIEVLDRLFIERAALLEVLRTLDDDEWELPTECPAWSVKGIVQHLLGDDVSLLSRQRDHRPDALSEAEPPASAREFFTLIDDFNERWVQASRFMSPRVLVELLELTGEWTHRWYADVDPNVLGEPVLWIGTDPAPYWLLAAREYLERWIHQQQIRRAAGRPGLLDAENVLPAVVTTLRGFPLFLSRQAAPVGASISMEVTDADASWTLAREADRWTLLDGAPAQPTSRIRTDLATLAGIVSRALARTEIPPKLTITGDQELAGALVKGVVAFFGR